MYSIFTVRDIICVGFTSAIFLTAGNFGVEKAVVAQAAYEAVMSLDERVSRQYLQTVRFVNFDSATTLVFVEVFKSLHGSLAVVTEDTDQRKTDKDEEVEGLPLQHVTNSQRKKTTSQTVDEAVQQLPNADAEDYQLPMDPSIGSDVDYKSAVLSEPLAIPLHAVAATDSQNDVPFRMITSCGIDVQVYRGNLLDEKVDAIVNPANTRLFHGGGAARAIAEAAGRQLQEECRAYIDEHEELKVTQVMHTTAGNLYPPVIYVIHVAGPAAAHFHRPDDLFQAVFDTFHHCLLYANSFLDVSSLSVPAIGSGEYV